MGILVMDPPMNGWGFRSVFFLASNLSDGYMVCW
jgi:hypothetical protein